MPRAPARTQIERRGEVAIGLVVETEHGGRVGQTEGIGLGHRLQRSS